MFRAFYTCVGLGMDSPDKPGNDEKKGQAWIPRINRGMTEGLKMGMLVKR